MNELIRDEITGRAISGLTSVINNIRIETGQVLSYLNRGGSQSAYINSAIDDYRTGQEALLKEAIANRLEYATTVFCIQHEITEEQLADDHWQTLFALTYPEVVS